MRKIYFLILFSCCFTFCESSFAQFTKLYDFAGVTDGSNPLGDLISDGNYLYGMTNSGGSNNLGTIFKIKPDGSGYVKLHDFTGNPDGSNPFGSLCSDGSFLYGMTKSGGMGDNGMIFKVKKDGSSYATLHDFTGDTDGSGPLGSLYYAGNFLYGMTESGGLSNLGIIFKVKTDSSSYVKLHDFTGDSDGSLPTGSFYSDGIFLYGMTTYGGVSGYGTIFKIMPDGSNFVKLHDFTGGAGGNNPNGSLISDGTYLYGMTVAGGLNNLGIIFKIQPDGSSFINVFNFQGTANGGTPLGSLIYEGTYLYGMTSLGGLNGHGVIFKIKPDGSGFGKLMDLANTSDGSQPEGSLISDGTFIYGMTQYGGANNSGVIFKYGLSVWLYGQVTFQRTYDNGFNSGAFAVWQMPDSGYLLSGNVFIRTDKNGDTLFFKKGYRGALYIDDTVNSNLFTNFPGTGGNDFEKVNSTGDVLWSKYLSGYPAQYYINGITKTLDGGMLISAGHYTLPPGLYAIALKTDSAGNRQWVREYNFEEGAENYSALAIEDSSFIVVGRMAWSSNNLDIVVSRVDKNGNIIWSKLYNIGSNEGAYNLVRASDGGIMIAGYAGGGAGGFDIYLIKTDINGTVQWSKTYGGTGHDFVRCINSTSDGGYVMAGITYSFPPGDTNVYVVKIKANGDTLWTRAYGGINRDEGSFIQETYDGGYIISGQSTSFGTGNQQAYLIKTDANGYSHCYENSTNTVVINQYTNTSNGTPFLNYSVNTAAQSIDVITEGGTLNTVCTDIGIPEYSNTDGFICYPNPFTTHLTITTNSKLQTLNSKQATTITLFDYTGKEILCTKANGAETVLNTEGIATGLYFIRVESGTRVAYYKVIKAN